MKFPLKEAIKQIGGDACETNASEASSEILAECSGEDEPWGDHSGRGQTSRLRGEEAADFEDLLGAMLKYAPQERITAEEVINHCWFSKCYQD